MKGHLGMYPVINLSITNYFNNSMDIFTSKYYKTNAEVHPQEHLFY